jgi:hypothetical protein
MKVALIAALETGKDLPGLTSTPEPTRQALIAGSHTEVPSMTSTTLVDLDRILAWNGFDVDAIPYGQEVTPEDLQHVELVAVMPVIDFPTSDGDEASYEETWREEEVEALVEYVEQGGFLILTNSARRVQLFGFAFEANEDWDEMNILAEHFGVRFSEGAFYSDLALVEGENPLMANVPSLVLSGNNAVPFTMETGEVIADSMGKTAAGLIDFGKGQVLVLADVSILDFVRLEPAAQDNYQFLQNIAQYIISR